MELGERRKSGFLCVRFCIVMDKNQSGLMRMVLQHRVAGHYKSYCLRLWESNRRGLISNHDMSFSEELRSSIWNLGQDFDMIQIDSIPILH